MTDWAAAIECLDKVADILDEHPGLDPDGAVRLAVWGSVDTPYPGDNEPGAEVFNEVESAIECYIAREDGHDPGDGIAWIPGGRAAAACRAEAARYRSYGDGT